MDESDFERPTGDDEWRVAKFLRERRDEVLARGKEPNGTDLVFAALQFRHDVYRRLPKVGPVGNFNAWPEYIHDAEEQAEAFKQQLIDVTAGDDPKEALGIQDKLNSRPNHNRRVDRARILSALGRRKAGSRLAYSGATGGGKRIDPQDRQEVRDRSQHRHEAQEGTACRHLERGRALTADASHAHRHHLGRASSGVKEKGWLPLSKNPRNFILNADLQFLVKPNG